MQQNKQVIKVLPQKFFKLIENLPQIKTQMLLKQNVYFTLFKYVNVFSL